MIYEILLWSKNSTRSEAPWGSVSDVFRCDAFAAITTVVRQYLCVYAVKCPESRRVCFWLEPRGRCVKRKTSSACQCVVSTRGQQTAKEGQGVEYMPCRQLVASQDQKTKFLACISTFQPEIASKCRCVCCYDQLTLCLLFLFLSCPRVEG